MEPAQLHGLRHPNVPFQHSAWSENATLHVAVPYNNPVRWQTRRQLFMDIRRQLEVTPNIKLYTGELAYGERPFDVTSPEHPQDFQWRSRHELWHKENLINLIINRFPPDWQYGAYIDGDFTFARYDWALEAIHRLQHYDWVQLFSHYFDRGYNHEPTRSMESFASLFSRGCLTQEELEAGRFGKVAPYTGKWISKGGIGATGGAWAFRRDSFDKCGGLLDVCILGSSDWHVAFGLAGLPDRHPQVHELARCGKHYAAAITAWQNRASKAVRQNIGVVPGIAVHHYHGDKSKRGYEWRWKILRDNNFDPTVDIFPDAQGVYQLSAEKPGLRDAIRHYFRSRDEDR